MGSKCHVLSSPGRAAKLASQRARTAHSNIPAEQTYRSNKEGRFIVHPSIQGWSDSFPHLSQGVKEGARGKPCTWEVCSSIMRMLFSYFSPWALVYFSALGRLYAAQGLAVQGIRPNLWIRPNIRWIYKQTSGTNQIVKIWPSFQHCQ